MGYEYHLVNFVVYILYSLHIDRTCFTNVNHAPIILGIRYMVKRYLYILYILYETINLVYLRVIDNCYFELLSTTPVLSKYTYIVLSIRSP